MIDSSRPDKSPFLNPDLQFRQPVQPEDRSIYQTSVLAFRGLVFGNACVFPFRLLSGEVQRAGFACGSSLAPSTPGGLGYSAVVWLIDLGRICSSSFLGFVLRGLLLFYRSPVIASRCRHATGTCL
jgi:hypothetical protein